MSRNILGEDRIVNGTLVGDADDLRKLIEAGELKRK